MTSRASISSSIRSLTLLQLLASAVVSLAACGQAHPHNEAPAFDPALMAERQRRIAVFDSVVRSVNTDSAYRLWHSTLAMADAKVGQQRVACEYQLLMYRYGRAADVAIRQMEDTLWRGVDQADVNRMRKRLVGESLPIDDKVCGPRTGDRAPYWLRTWYLYPLPQLPPSPTDTAPRPPGS